MENLFSLVGQYAIQAPLLLALLAGVALSLIRWQRQRNVAGLTLIVCVVSILDVLIGTYLSTALPAILISAGRSTAQIGAVLGIIGASRSALRALLWVAVLFAIFGWRRIDGVATATDS